MSEEAKVTTIVADAGIEAPTKVAIGAPPLIVIEEIVPPVKASVAQTKDESQAGETTVKGLATVPVSCTVQCGGIVTVDPGTITRACVVESGKSRVMSAITTLVPALTVPIGVKAELTTGMSSDPPDATVE